MKNLVKYFLMFIAFSFTFIACEDEDKEGMFSDFETENQAPYVRGINNTPIIDATALETAGLVIDLAAPSNNVVSWEVSVSKIPGSETPSPLGSVTTFPSTFSRTGAEIAAAMGLTTADMSPGDQLLFSATSTGTDGTVLTAADLGGDLIGQPEQLQAYTFSSFLGCPEFTSADLAGTWEITVDDFGTFLSSAEVEIIAGPGENQITILDIFDHPNPDNPGVPYDVILDFVPTTGVASVSKQPAWHCDNFGCPYGEGRVEGGGFAFACADLITLVLTHTVDLGSFGSYALEITR